MSTYRSSSRVYLSSMDTKSKKVIRTRDVMFNENTYYDAHDIDLLQAVNEPMLEITYELHDLDPITLITEIGSDDEEEERGIGMRENIQGMEENMEEIILDKNSGYGNAAEISSDDTYLLTPSPSIISSPSPNSSIHDLNSSESITAKSNKSRKASRDINSSVDTDNILPEGMERGRNRNRRYEAYSTALTQAKNGELNSYHAAFSANIMASSYYISNQEHKKDHTPTQSTCFHRDSLPIEPENYRQMLKHPHAEGFKLAMQMEIQALVAKNTWTEVNINAGTIAGKTPIPTMWMFKYKLDEKGCLVKYKSRLCARGDLQRTEQDTFAATLAARIF